MPRGILGVGERIGRDRMKPRTLVVALLLALLLPSVASGSVQKSQPRAPHDVTRDVIGASGWWAYRYLQDRGEHHVTVLEPGVYSSTIPRRCVVRCYVDEAVLEHTGARLVVIVTSLGPRRTGHGR